MNLQDIITALGEYLPNADTEIARNAYTFVREKHQGQTRASGEPYISHVQEVALLCCKLKLDIPSVTAALLHDTVEDTKTTLDEIKTKFGLEISELVDGVTKLNNITFSSKAEQQAENFRKMLLAMSKDIRVLLIKLCDRLHNMRTLEFLSESRRTRIANETLDIYAPLAHRLGIYWLKSELEDLCLRFLKPGIYENIKRHVNEKKGERESYIKDVCQLIQRELEQNNISGMVYGRPKHFFSIYQKMEKDDLSFNEIFDLIAFRVIVPTLIDCYGTLGLIHAAWKPIPGRFKDYIAMPKPNNYQSLHTTIIGPKGARIEIQIRTKEIHEVAEKGIAAHWAYKESYDDKKSITKNNVQFSWIRELVESGKSMQDPVEFITTVKDDLAFSEVFVFSPKGDLIALAPNSTPIDFAYHIHSQIGHQCTGAKVNGQQVPLSHKLQNGDTVEITTSNNQQPSKDWLNIVATNKAKQKIRSTLKAAERERSVAIGKELLTKDLRHVKLSLTSLIKGGSLQKASEALGLKDLEVLYTQIGYGKISTKQVIKKILPEDENLEDRLHNAQTNLQKIFQQAAKTQNEGAGIKISGFNDMVFRFARCCQPLPGDELVGYVTRGRGVAVHSRGCSQTLSFDPHRLIPVAWDSNIKTVRQVKIQILASDRIGILAQLSQSISNSGANIVSAQVAPTPSGKTCSVFEINVDSIQQLESITRSLEAVEGVIKVERHRVG